MNPTSFSCRKGRSLCSDDVYIGQYTLTFLKYFLFITPHKICAIFVHTKYTKIELWGGQSSNTLLDFDDFRTYTGFSPKFSTTVCPCELVARALSLTHQESKLDWISEIPFAGVLTLLDIKRRKPALHIPNEMSNHHLYMEKPCRKVCWIWNQTGPELYQYHLKMTERPFTCTPNHHLIHGDSHIQSR